MLNPLEFYKEISGKGINFFCGVPDSLLKEFNSCIEENVDEKNHVIAPNEGAAIGLATGYNLATNKIPLVYMQNSGQGNAINPLVSLADKKVYSIPMILVIGWRGEPGKKDQPQHLKQGEITLNLLETLNIDYEILPKDKKRANNVLDKIITKTKEKSSPCALIIRKDTFEKYSKKEKTNNYPITREEAIKNIVKNLSNEEVIVSTTGKISRELFECREYLNQNHKQDFLTIGSMGHCSQIALGVALTKKNKEVYCFDGDGAFIMHMGSITAIGKTKPKNFKHIVFNNGSHQSVGKQPTAGFNINIPKIAEASGYKKAWCVENIDELKDKLSLFKNIDGPALLEIKTNLDSRKDLGRPTKSPIENKKDFMNFLNK